MSVQDAFVKIKREFLFQFDAFRMFDDKLILYMEVTSSVCTFVAILTTLTRLFVRRRKLWFDDACTLLALICLVAQMVSIFTANPPYFTAYYIIVTMFYSTVWFSRLSILLSIIRLGNRGQNRHLYAVVVLFILLFSVLVGQLFWVCEPQRKQDDPICKPTKQIAILKLVSDVISDFFLLATSLQLFIVIQDKSLRLRLSCLFSTCVITTAVSLVNSCFILESMGLSSVIICLIEGSVSVIVSSVPVLSNICSRAGEPKPRRVGRTETTSAIHFARHTRAPASVTSLSETDPIPAKTHFISNTSPDDSTYEFQDRPRDPDPESKPDKHTHEP